MPENIPRVVVRDGEGVLRGEAVVDGDDGDAGFGGEGGDEVVELGAGGGAEAEPAAVDVDEEGEFLLGWGGEGGGGGGGEVETGGDAGYGGDEDVFGSDRGLRIVGGRGEFGLAAEAVDGAVFVYPEEGGEVVSDFSCGGGHCRERGVVNQHSEM